MKHEKIQKDELVMLTKGPVEDKSPVGGAQKEVEASRLQSSLFAFAVSRHHFIFVHITESLHITEISQITA